MVNCFFPSIPRRGQFSPNFGKLLKHCYASWLWVWVRSFLVVSTPPFPHLFQKATCEKMLNSDSWSSCTKLIKPEPYIQACMQDMCSCGNSTSDFCVCSTMSEFSRQCSHAGGQPPNWRTAQFCGKVLWFVITFFSFFFCIGVEKGLKSTRWNATSLNFS